MLKLLRRLISRASAPAELMAMAQWAQQHGHSFQRVRAAEGCVINGQQGVQPWRIEWGASQRSYIPGFELRLIAELGLPKELMCMVLNRSLMAAMEKTVYDQFVDDVQTRIDTDTPSEMRWLVMCSKVGAHDLGRLRERYGAVCSVLPWLLQWLASPLSDALAATAEVIHFDQPMALTIGRGRLTLRTTLRKPDAAELAIWFSVFEHAVREALRLGTEWRDATGVGLTTQPGAWSHSEAIRSHSRIDA
jgi:hypothetical protein